MGSTSVPATRLCDMGYKKYFNSSRHEIHAINISIFLHNEELSDLYSLPNILRVVKSRRMRWAGHVARMGEERGVHRVLGGNLRERDHWGDPDVDGRIKLR